MTVENRGKEARAEAKRTESERNSLSLLNGAMTDKAEREESILSRELGQGVHEPPYTVPYVRWCARTGVERLPPTRCQWGWGGFVTQDLKRSQIMARISAQIYNWWTLFARWINPEKHAEAITSRPLMLYGVAKESNHAGQKTIHITPMHGKAKENSEKVTFISSILNKIKRVAERFTPSEIWKRVLSMIFVKFLKGKILGTCNWEEGWWSEGRSLINSKGPPKIAIESA